MHTSSELTRDIYQEVRPAAAFQPLRGARTDSGRAPVPRHLAERGRPASASDALDASRPHPFQPAPAPAFPSEGTAFSGRAHGKVILLGEHAVVYGAPAVALALPSATCRAAARPGRQSGHGLVSFHLHTADRPGSPTEIEAPEALHTLVEAALERAGAGQVRGVELLVDSGIPPGRGLGSSAACARAVTGALDQLLDLRLAAAEVFELVQRAENVSHGRASGIDAHATGNPGLTVLHEGRTHAPPVGRQGWVVVADSGTSSSTRQAVEMLRTAFLLNPARRRDFLTRSTSLTSDGLDALATGQLKRLGRRLTETHTLLMELGLVTGPVHMLVDAALAAGALGAKMTGGGLGGCALALAGSPAQAERLATRLEGHGATRTWIAPLLEEGSPR
ncbi:mevalonate kinase [Streptomyces sp. NPDC001941]|uniref:mevalonate kinase n=1 Tax=Streptomyces sp. NPDC001941 TaxID=3154659 RepID=UPI0033249A63